MKKIRTGVDFSKHVHRIEIFKSETNPKNEIRIDHFQIGDSNQQYIQFINTNSTLTITGDYGNWVFCRPFIPSEDGYVSDGYWLEKASIASTQEATKYDPEQTAEAIQKLIGGELEEIGYEEENLEKLKDWFVNLLEYTDDELEYTHEAYRGFSRPDIIDYDYIPFVKETNIWLQIIFDAFDEICTRIKKEELV